MSVASIGQVLVPMLFDRTSGDAVSWIRRGRRAAVIEVLRKLDND